MFRTEISINEVIWNCFYYFYQIGAT